MNNAEMVQDLIKEFRLSFLAELPERLDNLEQLLLLLEAGGEGAQDSFNALYRGVHSIKGSGGTFGLHIITSICHEMEDYLNLAPLDLPRLDRLFIDNCLRFVDLIRAVTELANAGSADFSTIESRLTALHDEVFLRKLSALVVVNSKLTRIMCHEVLQSAGIRFVDEMDGMSALSRAMTQHFDFLLVSSELPLLKGEAMIASLRLSETENKRIKTVLICSNIAAESRRKRDIDPDFVLQRNAQLLPNLKQVVTQMLELG
ncbi:MAG: Hpt domain-containing protein [Sulfurimicrobium sp.]|nr:Hpt domain-containing protein [Sulfurimicrobium sp.]MDP1703725.1 Hpt domain-containing protein [Sulfurimicrobium sp.]MDP2198698.1 Hpt domain-containing protein [Sulfurimicrobium sp.]